MDCSTRPLRRANVRRCAPCVEGLESRRLPSIFAPSFYSYPYPSNQLAYQAAVVRHEYDQYVSELKRLELGSEATPAEMLALRDDARAISAAASSAKVPHAVAQYKAVEASLQLDHSPLYGWLGAEGWAEQSSQLTTTLDGLGVPQSLIAQTIADMRAIAVSAGVGPDGYATFTNDFGTLRNGEQTLPSNPYYHFEDPSLYYTQHLRGFFRGWGVQKVQAKATLEAALHRIEVETRTGSAGAAVLQHDAGLLENLGAALPSAGQTRFDDAYAAAFAQGTPTSPDLSQLRSNLVAILGPAGTAARIASVDALTADAPALYQAVGDSAARIETLVADDAALVDAGGHESLNPFRITITTA